MLAKCGWQNNAQMEFRDVEEDDVGPNALIPFVKLS